MVNLPPDQYRVLSLFSGGMGLDLGLEYTGHFRTVACIEKEPAFCETIRQNRDAGRLPKDLRILEADLSQLDPAVALDGLGVDPSSIDIVVGGPPCQSFSTAGRRGTTQDPRGTLLWDFLRFVSYIGPKFFLMENVRGLLSAALKHRPIAERPEKGGAPLTEEEKPGSVVRLFAKDLSSVNGGYHLDIFEVNAVNYGAPQLRERALFIGNKFGKLVEFPVPTHGPNHEGATQGNLFESPRILPWRTLGDALEGLKDPNPQIMDFSPRKKGFLEMVPEGSNWRSLPEDIQKESMGRAWHAKGGRSGWWRRLTFDLPCPTLVTMPNHASTSLCHPKETRALSIREYARIQEFPDDWQFSGTLSQQYAQVGNAVPTRLGRIAGEVIAEELDQILEEGAHVDEVGSFEPRIIYLQSHVRTRQWFKDGETLVWEKGDRNERVRYTEPKTLRKLRSI
ncbi:DNA cytosine methyltransferase [Leptolyngbya sp. PCC 6406]|uniref:DNA cytosine methyltransferase n=1 Tax=Leptolyngbya sp. PCC 6406 TaxID=1173264 RepID=UPI0002ACB1BE|nr:DNA cytosine methyltransferase [Leptolyngbya sp. PCC 6406]